MRHKCNILVSLITFSFTLREIVTAWRLDIKNVQVHLCKILFYRYVHMVQADIHLLILFPIYCPASPKKENNMWNWKMVLTEGFKDIWNLEYILKVNFSSNYVIMVKLLENAKHKINMLPDRKWQKTLSCVCLCEWVRVRAHVACVEAHTRPAIIHQGSFHRYQEHQCSLHVYETSTGVKDICTQHVLVLLVQEPGSLSQVCYCS